MRGVVVKNFLSFYCTGPIGVPCVAETPNVLLRTWTSPHTETITKSPIKPQMINVRALFNFSSSPAAVIYVMIPQRKTKVPRIINIGITVFKMSLTF